MDENLKQHFFKKAVSLAFSARPSPNPKVGALVVKNGKIISSAFHKKAGEAHAEALALKMAGEEAKGADLIVTLEPCHLYGKTPPCTEAIKKAGIKRVFIGAIDPNPNENGRSVEILKMSGIETIVETGRIHEMCMSLIEEWSKYIIKSVPFVRIKSAISLDGKIATPAGDSQWISSEKSLKEVHKLRAYHDAVMIGISTVLKDNPMLTVRKFKWNGEPPIRIVVDTNLKLPVSSKILENTQIFPTIIACAADSKRKEEIISKGGKILLCSRDSYGKVDLNDLLIRLGKMGITSILVEGGGKLITSFIEQKLADAITLFLSPILIGGENSPSFFSGRGIEKISDAIKIKDFHFKKSGSDIMIEGKF